MRRRDDLHIAGVGVDALQPRRRLARVVLEHLPAEPRLADLVEAAADRREFRRHGAFDQRMSLPVADQKPEIRCLGAQLFQLGRLPQDQVAFRVTRERALHDIDHAILVALREHEARDAERTDDDGNQRQQQRGLEREQAPAQSRAQAIGIVVLAHVGSSGWQLPQEIADAANAVDLDAGIGLGELAAQPRDMRVQRVRLDLVVEIVDGLFQRRAQHGAAHPADQGFEHQQLAAWQLERLAVDAGLAMADIEGEAAGADDVRRQARGPPQHGAQRASNSSTANGLAR